MILERVDTQLLFSHGGLRHFFFAGGRSVHTPSKTSAVMPIDSPSVGCGWIVLPMSTGSHAHFDGEADLSNQIAGVRTDDGAANAAVVGFVENELGEALVPAVGDRATRGRPREHCLAVLDALRLALLLGEPGPRDLRIRVRH